MTISFDIWIIAAATIVIASIAFLVAGFIRPKSYQKEGPDLRYADDSHNRDNWKVQSKAAQPALSARKISSSQRSYGFIKPRRIKLNAYERQELINLFMDAENLIELSLSCIRQAGQNGLNTKDANRRIAENLLENAAYIEYALKTNEVTDHLHKIRSQLAKSGKIAFNKKQKVWYPLKDVQKRHLTEKEKGFLRLNGLNPEGWVNIRKELDVIRWIKQNFTDDEFELFSLTIFEYCDAQNAVQSLKRKGSGADGGLDGTCDFTINNQSEKCAIEAKLYGLHRQVGEDICNKLIGVMDGRDLKYGFIITTGTFSDRSIERIRKTNEKGARQIELIDQNRLIEAMLIKKGSPHGLGLFVTELGFVYMNESMLWGAIKK